MYLSHWHLLGYVQNLIAVDNLLSLWQIEQSFNYCHAHSTINDLMVSDF